MGRIIFSLLGCYRVFHDISGKKRTAPLHGGGKHSELVSVSGCIFLYRACLFFLRYSSGSDSAVCGNDGPCTAAGSILSWFLYRAVFFFTEHVFFSCVTAAALTALYAEMMARWKKAPVTIFLIPSVLPLIPGSNLYYAVSAAVQDRTAEAIFQGSLTLQYTAAIALGCSLTGAFWMMNRKKS